MDIMFMIIVNFDKHDIFNDFLNMTLCHNY